MADLEPESLVYVRYLDPTFSVTLITAYTSRLFGKASAGWSKRTVKPYGSYGTEALRRFQTRRFNRENQAPSS